MGPRLVARVDDCGYEHVEHVFGQLNLGRETTLVAQAPRMTGRHRHPDDRIRPHARLVRRSVKVTQRLLQLGKVTEVRPDSASAIGPLTLPAAARVPWPPYLRVPPSRSSTASPEPVDASDGTPARTTGIDRTARDTARVGRPRESRTSTACTDSMSMFMGSLPLYSFVGCCCAHQDSWFTVSSAWVDRALISPDATTAATIQAAA